jgi:hypothetical protein
MTATEEQTQEHCERHEEKCFCMGAGPELFAMFKKLGPDSARQHFRNARVEMLKGMRALIDQRIDELDQETETKGTKVTID